MNPRITKTANSKPSNNEGRLYFISAWETVKILKWIEFIYLHRRQRPRRSGIGSRGRICSRNRNNMSMACPRCQQRSWLEHRNWVPSVSLEQVWSEIPLPESYPSDLQIEHWGSLDLLCQSCHHIWGKEKGIVSKCYLNVLTSWDSFIE